MQILRVFAALVGAAAAVHAVETKTWTVAEMADFERGNLTRLSLASDGRLTLAPALKELADPSVTFLWAVARDSKGDLFAGGGGLGGSKAKLIEIDASGKMKTLAELDALAVQSIAIDREDRVYAATAPDGKVYRVDSAGKVEPFFDPKAKYIWAMAVSKSGDLFVATGDEGKIFRVTPSGAGTVFFETEETHVRSLAIDANGNLIAGTDPSGLILRITPAGAGFVLYQAPKREITSVAVGQDGAIYAAGVGDKTPAPALPVAPVPIPSTPPGTAGAPTVTLTLGAHAPAPAPPPSLGGPAPAITGGSEIYRIQPDGYPRRIWSHSQDLVYALSFDSKGRLIAGAGNRGAIFRIDNDHSYTQLLKVPPTQVTAFAAAPDGRIFAVTGNIGKIFSIGPGMETSGVFESDIFDAGAFSYWGRLNAETAGEGSIEFETRSGNLNRAQKNWSEWAKLNGGRITSPPARFVEYRATLTRDAELDEVDVAYLMKNVAPQIEGMEITAANYKFPAPAAPSTSAGPSNPTLNLPPMGHNRPAPALSFGGEAGSTPALTYSKGQIGARWLAEDPNGDTMAFKIEIRGVNETVWKLLKDDLREHYYSWDSTAFPDGKYVLRITASDAPSNPPAEALTATLESDPFLIDNTAPEITGLTGTPAGSQIEVRFHAHDGLSVINKAEYSVNGGEWTLVDPVSRLSDSKDEDYRVMVNHSGETTVAVRVWDEYDNQAVAKTVVK
ncbi:MAG TPA: hypothetical protein VK419_01785 [Bryobacteraceae bacterium]|nr:hypothetical protein [Bryobacteraceae bacterium]